MTTMPTRKEEIAWAAGLFEGEGCTTKSGGVLVARLNSTDEETPMRFCRPVRAGKVYGPYDRTDRDGYMRKPMWIWVASSVDALEAVRLLMPWLGRRRAARARVLAREERLRLG